jgi:hypothetical protein
MKEIHEKLSMWGKLQSQWKAMESGLRSINPRPAAPATEALPLSPMEVELRALRAKVDTAFNDAMEAISNQPKVERTDPAELRRELARHMGRDRERAPGRDNRPEHPR